MSKEKFSCFDTPPPAPFNGGKVRLNAVFAGSGVGYGHRRTSVALLLEADISHEPPKGRQGEIWAKMIIMYTLFDTAITVSLR